jgi:Putative zinc-finger
MIYGGTPERHPERDLLLPYLDGELTSRQSRQVRRHVRTCWQCRAELDELQKTVGDCVRYHGEMLGEVMPPPPRPWADLSREFARVDASCARRPLFARPLARWTAFAGMAASLLAATLTWRAAIFRPAAPPPEAKSQPVKASAASPARAIPGTDSQALSVPGIAVRPSAETAPPPAGPGDELQAMAALHQLGADLGDPVEVAREGSQVVVSGAGISTELQRRIQEAMLSIPHVVVRFSEPAAPPPDRLPAAADTAPASPASPSTTPSRLESELGGRAQLASFSSQLLDHDEAAMARIYAVHRLAQQFPQEVERQLDSGKQRLLWSLAREHIAALATEVSTLDRLAAPILLPLASSAPLPPRRADAANWQAAAESLFQSARQSDTILAALLEASAPEQPANNLAQRFLTSLAQLQADMQQCDLFLMH